MSAKSSAPPIAMLFVTLAIAGQAQLAAPETGRVGIFFPPWIAADDAMLRTVSDRSVAFVGQGNFENIIIAETTDPESKARFYDAGAWWVFDPTGFGGCFSQRRSGV